MNKKEKNPTIKEVDIDRRNAIEKTSQVTKMKQLLPKEKEMAEEYSYIINAVASVIFSKKKMPPAVEYNDLLSVGFDGLIKAIRKFDDSKNAQFKTYANIRVRGEILDFLRKEWKLKASHQHQKMTEDIQERVNQVMNNHLEHDKDKKNIKNLLSSLTTSYVLSLDMAMEQYGDNIIDDTITQSEKIIEGEDVHFLNTTIQTLAKEEQVFIDMFYRQGKSQKVISGKLNVSPATMSRMHHKIIESLKEKMEAVVGIEKK